MCFAQALEPCAARDANAGVTASLGIADHVVTEHVPRVLPALAEAVAAPAPLNWRAVSGWSAAVQSASDGTPYPNVAVTLRSGGAAASTLKVTPPLFRLGMAHAAATQS